MSCGKTYLTEELRSLIGFTGERVEVGLWGIEQEGLRRFTQALMDPDPRYWDVDFVRSTRYGDIVTPGIFCSYLNKTPPGTDDPVTKAFQQNPVSDGNAVERGGASALPRARSKELLRILNGGNEIEILQYPKLGDRIYSQGKIANIEERVGRDGSHMLITTTETIFTNQTGDVLCMTRYSVIQR